MKNKSKIILLNSLLIVFIISCVFIYKHSSKTYSTERFSFKSKLDLSERIIKLDNNNWFIIKPASSNLDFRKKNIYSTILCVVLIEENVSDNEFYDSLNEIKNIGGIPLKKYSDSKYKIEYKVKDINLDSYILKTGKTVCTLKFYSCGNSLNLNDLDAERIFNTFKYKKNNSKIVQSAIKDILSKDEAIQDMKELHKLLKINPGLYFNITEKELDKNFNDLNELLNSKDKWSKNELFENFSKITAKIKDGHTFFYNEEGDNPLYFPLDLLVRNKEFYIKNDEYYKLGGAKLLKINGINVKDIYEKFIKIVSYGNGYVHFGEYMISKSFRTLFSYTYGNSDNYSIEYSIGNRNFKKTFDKHPKIVPFKQNNNKTFEYYEVSKEIDILKIYSFAEQENFEKEIETLGEKKYKNLIVDIRNNTGGSPQITERFSHLMKKVENQNTKKKNVYLLVDRGSFSASVYLNFLSKINKITIIGETPGGFLNTLGDSTMFKLRNSGFKIFIATSYTNFSKKCLNKEQIDKTFYQPDYLIDIDPRLEAMGVDQVMEKVKELIKENN